MPSLSRARALVVPALALALAVPAAAPAAAATPYLEPTVTVAEGRAALPTALSPVAGSEDAVVVNGAGGTSWLLSGPNLSVALELPREADYYTTRIVGDQLVMLGEDDALVVDIATGAMRTEPYVGKVVSWGTTATGWLEYERGTAPHALIRVRLDGDTVTRDVIGELPNSAQYAYASPSGRRVIIQSADLRNQVWPTIDVDVMAGTVTEVPQEYFVISAVSDDTYIGFTRSSHYERVGPSGTTRWPGDYIWSHALWEGRTIEFRYPEGYANSGVFEIADDGTATRLPETPLLTALRPERVQVSDTLVWGGSGGALTQVRPDGITPAPVTAELPGERRALRIPAVLMTDGTVRWTDDAENTRGNTFDVRSRDLAGGGAPSLVGRNVSSSPWLAVEGGQTYALRQGPQQRWSDLVRVTPDGDADAITTVYDARGLSAAPGKVGVAGWPGAILDTSTGALTETHVYFETLAGPWEITLGSDMGWSSRRLTATAGATTTIFNFSGEEGIVRVSGSRAVVQATKPATTRSIYLVDLTGKGRSTTVTPQDSSEDLLAAGGARFVTHDQAAGELVVRSIHDGGELVRIRADQRPRVALDESWIAWTTPGPDGDRLVAAPLAGTPSPTFDDVKDWHPFRTEIAWLVDNGIAQGYSDGTFGARSPVSRQAMAAFLYRASGSPAFAPPTTASFSDVPTTHPFFREIEWLADSGVAGGYADGTFKPTAPVSRQAMAAFLHRHAGEPTPGAGAPTFPDVPAGHQFRTAISWLAQTEVTTGYADGTFKPAAAVSRQAMAAFLYRYDRLDD